MGTDAAQEPARRRNKQQPPHAAPQNAVPATDAVTQSPGSSQTAVKPPDSRATGKQKPNSHKQADTSSRSKAADVVAATTAPVAGQQTPIAAKGSAAPHLSSDRLPVATEITDSAPAKAGHGQGNGNTKPLREVQPQQRQQQQQPQQSRTGVSGQQSRPAASTASSKAAASSSSGKTASNYSAAVTGLAQSTAALKLNQAESSTHRNAAADMQPQRTAAPGAASSQQGPAATVHDPARQQRYRQQQQQQQEGSRHQHQQQKQQAKQQAQHRQRSLAQGQAASWDSMPGPHAGYGQQGPQRSPSVDWSFQGLGQPAVVPHFARNPSGGSLPGMPTWAPDLGVHPPVSGLYRVS